MVLTRLSHIGEVCPLRDHSYSDPMFSPGSSNRQNIIVPRTIARPSLQDPAVSIHILDLPNEILEKILYNLTFRNVSEIRRVCLRFKEVGASMLNITFLKVQADIQNKFQTTKSLMPRRESSRRKHHLARECDIVETLHMRITLLQMTFGKHIDRKHCCFFAGEILDEVFRIIRVMKSPNIGKVCKETDELFDLSSMAMEYFKEYIEPSLPEISYRSTEFLDVTSLYLDKTDECDEGSVPEDDITDNYVLPPSNMVLRKRIRKIRQGMKRYNSQLVVMKREMKVCKGKLTDQNKQLLEYAKRLEEYDQKFEESSRKFSTVFQELNKYKTELQYWRSRSPVHPAVCSNCSGRLSSEIVPVPLFEAAPCDFEPSESLPFDVQPGISLQDDPTYLPLPLNAGVKNLEPLFDTPTVSSFCITNASSLLSCPFSSFETIGDDLLKRFSSDDDSDMEIDTVGRRVKERKRIKLDIH